MVRSFMPRDFQTGNEFGRDAVNAHGDKLIRLGMLVTEGLHFFDEVRRDAVNAEGN